MEFSSSNVPISRETWAPRSPGANEDRYSERPPVSAGDVDGTRERRDSERDDRDDRRDDRDDRRDDREEPRDRDAPPRGDRRDDDRAGGPGGYRGGYDRRDAPTPSRPNNAPKSEPNNVLGVFGLSIRTRERDLEDEFSRYGEVDKVTIVYDQRTDRSRGFGFITMRQVEDAGRCIEKLNGMVLHGRAIRVDYSATQKAHAPTPGEYRGEKRPFDDRFAADRRGGRGYDDRYRGGDRYGDRYDGGGRDDRRGGWDRPTWRDRDGPYGGAPRRDDDPYGGRARRDDDRERGGDRDAAPRGGNDREGGDRERRRSPSPARRRYSRSPERRPAAPTETREEPRPY